MKYIIEIKPEYEDKFRGIMILGAENSNLYVDSVAVDELEELNSDYINEHFGDLQDTAYQKGLDDAWECGKKLAWTAKYGGYGERLNDVFGRDDTFDFYDYTPNEAIEKLKAFEQKQDKIEVGDEVEWDNDFTGDRFIVTRIYQPYGKKEQCDGIDDDGDVYRAVLIESLVKTGRHFDIQSILEDMKHD